MRRTLLFTGILAAALAGSAAITGFSLAQSPADVVAARQQTMRDKSAAVFRTMRPFVQNGTGSLAAVQTAAETLASHNGKYQALWPRGTELGVAGSKTRPELWQQTDRLNQLIADMERNATAMAVAARSGDAGQIRTAFGGVVGSCNACHDAYQSR